MIVFFRTRLEDIWTMAAFAQVLTQKTITTIAITTTSAIVNDIGEYKINLNPPNDIPQGGAIRITYPTTLIAKESNCRNDIIGGSELCQTGIFNCVVDSVTKTILISGCELYDQSVATIGIQVLVRMQNPATTGALTPWTVETWY